MDNYIKYHMTSERLLEELEEHHEDIYKLSNLTAKRKQWESNLNDAKKCLAMLKQDYLFLEDLLINAKDTGNQYTTIMYYKLMTFKVEQIKYIENILSDKGVK